MSQAPTQVFEPHALKGYIDRFEVFEIGGALTRPFRVLPLGVLQVFFQLNRQVYHNTSFTNGWEVRPIAFLAGPYNLGYEMAVEQGVEMFSLKFKPGRYQHFFEQPIAQFKNQLIPLSDVWGKAGGVLVDCIFEAKDHKERSRIVEQFLLQRFKSLSQSPIEMAVRNMSEKNGTGKISNLAEASNLSASQFRKRFTNEIGLSPKEFQRIIRIGAIREHRIRDPKVSLTQLAYRFNYYDQSHFIHDFQMITGQPPGKYFS